MQFLPVESNESLADHRNQQKWRQEADLIRELQASNVDAALVNRLVSDGWYSGELLPELTTDELKSVGFRASQIATMKRFFRKHSIPNLELNQQS
jgi:hypothetical protein